MKQALRRQLVNLGGRLPASLRRIAYEIGAPLYYGAVLDPRCTPSIEWSLGNMARLGFAPSRVLDVGAYHGEWTTMARRVFPAASIHMIEAQSEKEPLIAAVAEAARASYSIEALGAEAGRLVTFYAMESGSSVFPERSTVTRSSRNLTTTTLDSVVSRLRWDAVGLLKVDVQGYELEVLRGAAGVLATVEALLLEVSVIPVNEGAPAFAEVIRFLEDRGLVVYDIGTLFRRPLDRALIQVDVVFVRATSPLLKDRRLDSGSEGRASR